MRLPMLAAMVLIGTLCMAGCQSMAAETPAVLTAADEASMTRLRAVLGDAVGRANVTLGPGDVTQTSTISVLPPPLGPLETNSTAQPILFDIILRGETCVVVRRDTGAAFELAGVSCRPAF